MHLWPALHLWTALQLKTLPLATHWALKWHPPVYKGVDGEERLSRPAGGASETAALVVIDDDQWKQGQVSAHTHMKTSDLAGCVFE